MAQSGYIQAILVAVILQSTHGAYLVKRGHTTSADDNYTSENLYYAMAQADHNGTYPPAASGGRPGSATSSHACGSVGAVPNYLRTNSHMWPRGLGYFYQKYTHAYGIPILGSSRLSDSAIRRACYVVRFLFADRPDLRQSYYKMFGRFALMATTEVTTNIPEHTSLGAWWNARARGLGATRDRPVSTGGEENALCLPRDKYSVEDIVLHEFSHGLHLLGAAYKISGFEQRIRNLYNSARSAGRWRNTYAMSTDREYWAEGVQSYFNANAYSNPPNGIHNHVNTRDKLRVYDPYLYNLIREVFPCGNSYISRCKKDRGAEARQVLKMDCDSNGNDGNKSPPPPPETSTPTSTPTTIGPSPPLPPGCEDNQTDCQRWAKEGWCKRAPTYMNKDCPFTCGICAMSTSATTTRTTTRTTTTTQAPLTTAVCKDDNRHCAYWASTNQCRVNQNYMKVYCRRSCRVC